MLKCFCSSLAAAFVLLAAFFSPLTSRAASSPIFVQTRSFTNTTVTLSALNNDGDVLAMIKDPTPGSYATVPVIFRGTNTIALTPVPTEVLSVIGNGISDRRDDGHVFVAGQTYMSDTYRRACVWDVAANGAYTFTIATNIVLPEDSYAPGEQGAGYGYAINKSGVMVGSGSSYLAGLAIRWMPPYNVAQRFGLSTGSAFVDINDDGLMLASGIEFDHGGENNRLSAGIVTAGGGITEIPLINYVPGDFYPDYATQMRGQWVIGQMHITDPNGSRGFISKIGGGSTLLPNPSFALDQKNVDAQGVNSSGTVVGVLNGGQYSRAPIYWQNNNGALTPLSFRDLLPAEPSFPGQVDKILINNAGAVAVAIPSFGESYLRVYEPETNGIVQFVYPSGYAEESAGKIDFHVTLARAAENSGPVTLSYRTIDDIAKSGVDFQGRSGTVTWSGGESGEKIISLPVIDNTTYDETMRSFTFQLTGATGATLSGETNATAYIVDPYPQVTVLDQIAVQGTGYGVAVVQGQTNVTIRFERVGTDGALTITNFQGMDISAYKGTDYQIPDNLSVHWAAGEGGIKTVSIPLLSASASGNSKTFTLTANGILEGMATPIYVFTGVVIAKPTDAPALNIQNNTPPHVISKISLAASAVQGTTLQLQSAPTLDGPWTTIAEVVCKLGVVNFEAPIQISTSAGYFQIRVKP